MFSPQGASLLCTMANSKYFPATFGQLEGSSDRVVLPSILGYRERSLLHKQHDFEYGKIYNNAQNMNVYNRLTQDAVVRQTLKAMHTPAANGDPTDVQLYTPTGSANGSSSMSLSKSSSRPPSGFVSNNNTPMLTRSLLKIGSASSSGQHAAPPLGSLHSITLKSYYKHYPLDFMAAARPQAQTTNQTLRMLGTYSSDFAVAKALNAHIPPGLVKTGFHPDVKS